MFCEQCGKPLRDGARFCPVCGAEQSGVPEAEGPVGAPRPRQAQAPRPSRAPAPKKKKSKAPLIITLVLVLALLAGGGWLLYQNVLFPQMVIKDAERLVDGLSNSPLGDTPEDFRIRVELYDHNYYEIPRNQEARQKVRDFVRGRYLSGDTSSWVHALCMLQENGLFSSKDDTNLLLEQSDLEDLCGKGWAVNLNGGWYSNYDNQSAVYQKYAGFRDKELFDTYVWGDFFAVRSHEYGWTLFYRDWELRDIEPARWSITSDTQMQSILQGAKTYGDLLILPYDDDIFYDAYLVLNTRNGDFFFAYFD